MALEGEKYCFIPWYFCRVISSWRIFLINKDEITQGYFCTLRTFRLLIKVLAFYLLKTSSFLCDFFGFLCGDMVPVWKEYCNITNQHQQFLKQCEKREKQSGNDESQGCNH